MRLRELLQGLNFYRDTKKIRRQNNFHSLWPTFKWKHLQFKNENKVSWKIVSIQQTAEIISRITSNKHFCIIKYKALATTNLNLSQTWSPCKHITLKETTKMSAKSSVTSWKFSPKEGVKGLRVGKCLHTTQDDGVDNLIQCDIMLATFSRKRH